MISALVKSLLAIVLGLLLLGLATGLIALNEQRQCQALIAAGYWVYNDKAGCYAVVGVNEAGAPLYLPVMASRIDPCDLAEVKAGALWVRPCVKTLPATWGEK